MFIALDNMIINTDNIETMEKNYDGKQHTTIIRMASKTKLEITVPFEEFTKEFWKQTDERSNET